MAVMIPRCIRSITSRDRPDFTTCAPIIQITGRPAWRAVRMCRADGVQIWTHKGRGWGFERRQVGQVDQVAALRQRVSMNA